MPHLIAVSGPTGLAGLLDQLASRWPDRADGSLTIVDADSSGQVSARDLRQFLMSVGAADDIVLVLAVSDWDHAGARLQSLLAEILRIVPRLPRLRTWVVGPAQNADLDEELATNVQELLDGRAETMLRGVVLVSPSTSTKALTDETDRIGMLADATWALTTGGLAQHPNALGEWTCAAWWTAGKSFTCWAADSSRSAAAAQVLHVLEEGILRSETASTLDSEETAGREWVRERKIGTQDEYQSLIRSTAGDAFQLIALSGGSAGLRPEAWAAGIDRDYLEAAGAPLGRFRRLVRANAKELLHGRRDAVGDHGHLASLTSELDALLQAPSGLKRAAHFLNGVAAELTERRKAVANAGRTGTESSEVRAEREHLVRAVATLPSARPWLIRSAVLIALTASLAVALPALVAPLLPIGSAVVMGAVGAGARARASRARTRYQQVVQRRLNTLGEDIVYAEWEEMIDAILHHAGSFRGESQELTDMEDSLPPTPGSLARRVYDVWQGLLHVQQELRSRTSTGGHEVPDAGSFALFYPNTDKGAAEISAIVNDQARIALSGISEQAQDALQEINISDEDSVSRVRTELLSLTEISNWTLANMLEFSHTARQELVALLDEPNSPITTDIPAGDPLVITTAPQEVLDRLHEFGDEAEGLTWPSADRGRLVRLWFERTGLEPAQPPPLDIQPGPEVVPGPPPPSVPPADERTWGGA